jgi:glyoxalase family protein
MEITGLHHTSHITADAATNNAFYTRVLGLRRTWKTINFDDPRTYHLAYGDRAMTPGTNLTFFEHPAAPPARPGRRSLSDTALRVGSAADLDWWADRLTTHGLSVEGEVERFGRAAMRFADPEGLALLLVADGDGGAERVAWPSSPVPEEHQLHGLDSVTVTVDDPRPTGAVLERVLGMQRLGDDPRPGHRAAAVYGIDGGGPGREVHVLAAPDAPRARLGAGGTHHVAFRAPSLEAVDRYAALVTERRLPSSGVIDRTFFHNLYFREPGGALFEIDADVPGRSPYAYDAEIGTKLVLPDHLEPQRAEIERSLHPIEERAAGA